MGRPRTAIGTFGEFTYVTASNGTIKARVRFRDDDGPLVQGASWSKRPVDEESVEASSPAI